MAKPHLQDRWFFTPMHQRLTRSNGVTQQWCQELLRLEMVPETIFFQIWDDDETISHRN